MGRILRDQRTFAGAVILVLVASVVVNSFRDDDDSSADDPAATPTVNTSPDGTPSGSASPTEDETSEPATDRESGLPIVNLSELPAEAEETAQLIAAGGPFPYADDGETFLNSDGFLPERETGYYQVYTVDTPGSAEPTERRLITGQERELYWTDDLYESFQRVEPGR